MRLRYDLEIESSLSLFKPADFLSAVKLQCEMLPEYLPEKFGWSEPLLKVFDVNDVESLIPSDRDGLADNVWWKRTGRRRAEGSWMTSWGHRSGTGRGTHSSVSISVFDSCFQDKLIAYLKSASVHNKCDFSFIDVATKGYEPLARVNGMAPYGGGMSCTTHVMRHWLPDILWATVLGPAYVRMFGKDRVLASPAYVVKELGPETIYLQLTPKLEDIEENFDEVMAARLRVKQHLGMDAFFEAERAYDWREHPELAGKVFRVPEFQLLPD